MKKIFYTWEMFDEDIIKILNFLKKENRIFNKIYGLPKGGLPMAVYLANVLNLELVLLVDEIDETTLVVDDISDSGKTLLKMHNIINLRDKMNAKLNNINNLRDKFMSKNNLTVITIFSKDGTSFVPWMSCRRCRQAGWIVFPWEGVNKNCIRDGTSIK